MGAPVHNIQLHCWVVRLSDRSHQALLLLLDGSYSGKQIAQKTGVAEPNVSRIRKTYERLSGRPLPRVEQQAA
jgi:DNA-directed RNA polymerase specialized sigma subunit